MQRGCTPPGLFSAPLLPVETHSIRRLVGRGKGAGGVWVRDSSATSQEGESKGSQGLLGYPGLLCTLWRLRLSPHIPLLKAPGFLQSGERESQRGLWGRRGVLGEQPDEGGCSRGVRFPPPDPSSPCTSRVSLPLPSISLSPTLDLHTNIQNASVHLSW